MWNKWILLTLVGFVGYAAALRCHSCEGLCNCLQPSTIDCSFNTQCYTVKRLSDGKITRKGCTSNCNAVNDFDGMCTLCRGQTCNTETSLTPMSGSYDECQNDFGRPQGLGQGVQPQGLGGQSQGLGQGVQPQGLGGQSQGLGQGIGTQGLGGQGIGAQAGLGGQGVQPQGLGQGVQPHGLGTQGLGGGATGHLNYQPAPSIGSSNQYGQQLYGDGLGQGYNDQQRSDNGLGQGYNGLGQPYNGNNLGQGYNGIGRDYGNTAFRNTLNSLVLSAAAYIGLNRL